MGGTNLKNTEEGEIETGVLDGEEFGGDCGAEEWAMGPR